MSEADRVSKALANPPRYKGNSIDEYRQLILKTASIVSPVRDTNSFNLAFNKHHKNWDSIQDLLKPENMPPIGYSGLEQYTGEVVQRASSISLSESERYYLNNMIAALYFNSDFRSALDKLELERRNKAAAEEQARVQQQEAHLAQGKDSATSSDVAEDTAMPSVCEGVVNLRSSCNCSKNKCKLFKDWIANNIPLDGHLEIIVEEYDHVSGDLNKPYHSKMFVNGHLFPHQNNSIDYDYQVAQIICCGEAGGSARVQGQLIKKTGPNKTYKMVCLKGDFTN